MISSLGSYGGSGTAQWQQKLFSKADSNSDSALSKDELLEALKNGPKGKNGEDSSAVAEKMFSAMDSDGDGSVTQSEFTAFQSKMSASNASTLLAAQEGQRPDRPSAEDMLAETDTNGDGSISKDELAAVLEKHAKDGQNGGPSVDEMFSSMDSDGDGSVSESELTAFAEKAPSGPPPGGAPPPGGTGGTSSTSSSQTYDALDTNKDGVVSLSERLAAGKDSAAMSGNLSSGTLGALLASINEVAA
jgi:Ca2+-binding EF-hand superfamily protein